MDTPTQPARLNDKQLAAIDRLVLGENITTIAQEIGVGRQTIYQWQMKPEFRNELDVRRATIHDQVFDRLRDLVPKALTLMERAIVSEMAKDNPDWRVAAKVLDLLEKSRPAMPLVDVAVAVETVATDDRDLDGPPKTRLRSMTELRQRNRQSWQEVGQLAGAPVVLDRGRE